MTLDSFTNHTTNHPNQLNTHILSKGTRRTWCQVMSNVLGQLAQGFKSFKGANDMSFVLHSKIPKTKKEQVYVLDRTK